METLDSTINEINRRLAPENRPKSEALLIRNPMLEYVPVFECADGFCVSVQASSYHYCEPRTNDGPWASVEVGFPSSKADALMPYAENPNAPTETVYARVPIQVVAEVVMAHGGFAG